MKIGIIFYSIFEIYLSSTRFILVVQLVITLLLPRVQQSIHSMHNHDAHNCDEDNTHIHKVIHSCEGCDVFTHILAYHIVLNLFQKDRPVQSSSWLDFQASCIEVKLIHSDLRAPPMMV